MTHPSQDVPGTHVFILDMDVSKNRENFTPPNHPFVHMVWNHYNLINHPFWGVFTLIFGSTPICTQKINGKVYFGKTKMGCTGVQVY